MNKLWFVFYNILHNYLVSWKVCLRRLGASFHTFRFNLAFMDRVYSPRTCPTHVTRPPSWLYRFALGRLRVLVSTKFNSIISFHLAVCFSRHTKLGILHRGVSNQLGIRRAHVRRRLCQDSLDQCNTNVGRPRLKLFTVGSVSVRGVCCDDVLWLQLWFLFGKQDGLVLLKKMWFSVFRMVTAI